WDAPRTITTRNTSYLARFQRLCERHGLKPTYLTDWEMVNDPEFVSFARALMVRGTCEVGMHLHAWNSPPLDSLTDDDFRHQPYLIEYPASQMREKIRRITDLLEEKFDVKMRSHRAGRWAFNEVYAQILIDCGYTVDCSVTPGVSWSFATGDPKGVGGTDYGAFPTDAYFVDPKDIRRSGESTLLEIPMTIRPSIDPPLAQLAVKFTSGLRLARKVVRRIWPSPLWLRPNGHNRTRLLDLMERVVTSGDDYVEFMLHSSEFMPGGSPYFPTENSIEKLYEDLEALFERAGAICEGMTLSSYRERHAARAPGRTSGGIQIGATTNA
ncbi:MAG TPA: deacetylase, partial [Burkholderiaceae bacterium]|nr:deacetylase [Burkholderiaceae bacterium]